MRYTFVLSVCGVALSAGSAEAQDTRVTWPRTADSNTSCQPESQYRLRVRPDQLGIFFTSGWEYFKASAEGKIKANTSLPGGLRLLIEADLTARTARVTNLGNLGCTWAGPF